MHADLRVGNTLATRKKRPEQIETRRLTELKGKIKDLSGSLINFERQNWEENIVSFAVKNDKKVPTKKRLENSTCPKVLNDTKLVINEHE